MRVFIFRKTFNGFEDWCKQVKYCTHSLYSLKQAPRWFKNYHKLEMKECRLVVEQYRSLTRILTDKQKEYLELYKFKGKIADYNYISLSEINDLYTKWEGIVFPRGKSRLNFVTNKEIGQQIRKARIVDGRSRKEVAELIGIKQETLKSYEIGKRTLPSDILLLLTQIYGFQVDIKDLFPINESLLFLYKD